MLKLGHLSEDNSRAVKTNAILKVLPNNSKMNSKTIIECYRLLACIADNGVSNDSVTFTISVLPDEGMLK